MYLHEMAPGPVTATSPVLIGAFLVHSICSCCPPALRRARDTAPEERLRSLFVVFTKTSACIKKIMNVAYAIM